MSELIKQHFRATNGLDASNEKVINVAKADMTSLHDAVNVEFFVEQNTIQEYDPTRGYKKKFAVTYNGRIWIAKEDIASPAGDFLQVHWSTLRTDPKWEYIAAQGKQLLSGDFISADTTSSELSFALPSDPQDGDTIAIRDIGGNVGYNSLTVTASNQRIALAKNQLTSLKLTHPYSIAYFVFSNRLWQTFITDHESVGKIVNNSGVDYLAQASDTIFMRFPTDGALNITLPKYANSGDIVRLSDLDEKAPQNHFVVSSFDNTSSVEVVGVHKREYRTSGNVAFVYDSGDKLWRIWNGDLRQRLRIIRDDVTLVANESVMVFGANNSTVKTININLPTDIEVGDNVRIALDYMRKGQTVNINAATGDTIATNKTMLQFPRRGEYPPDIEWVQVPSITFNGDQDYVPIIQLSYIEDSASNTHYWVVSDISPRVERVDANNRSRLGVIALATQTQANVDKSSNPEKELAITPELLANRTATETRQGIAAIATTSQVNQDSTATYDDLTVVTPKKLNERTATETRRGLAEIGTQDEVDKGTDDTVIVTPKKLDAHRATETMAGVAPIVTSGGTKPTVRNVPGSGVFDYLNNSSIVTPKALREIKASQFAQGGAFLATDVEVIQAPADNPIYPLIVTPENLHKKTATEGRIGFTQTATQQEVNSGTDDFKYVTSFKLNSRKSTETLDGIIRIGTQTEFNNGLLDNVATTPLKLKTFFSSGRTSVSSASGLTQSGNIWSGLSLDIQKATETQRGTARMATMDEVDAGENDDTFVTPKRLQLKKATETTEGSIRFATAEETKLGETRILAVSPYQLKNVIQQESTWEASPTTRGPVKISENSITFVGNDTVGSTQAIDLYVKSGYAISPYELNKTLANFMPLKATAVNSSQLGGQTPDKYIRRDIDQTVTGALTLSKALNVSSDIVATGSVRSDSLTTTNGITSGSGLAASIISYNAKGNLWYSTAGNSDGKMTFISNQNSVTKSVLELNANGNAKIDQSLTVGNLVSAVNGVTVNGDPAITPAATSLTFGNTNKATLIKSSDASVLSVQDSSGTYNVINKKNYIDELRNDFLRKNVDDVSTGIITFTKPTKQAQSASINKAFVDGTDGNFVVEITNDTTFNGLPGYVVPVYGKDQSGADTPYIDSYTTYKGPGTLTQTASDANKYQTWAPRPSGLASPGKAQTYWIRNFNKATNAWDEWSRIYTSANPPTVKELGAVSTNNSSFESATIRDFIQVGNVRIRPDNDLKTVVFEWIE
ncbi:long tail fiber proximal subunit [Erwinia phage FBB1]|nr:long tail fiber proximal subunit [Erwinia phage FBB1]